MSESPSNEDILHIEIFIITGLQTFVDGFPF